MNNLWHQIQAAITQGDIWTKLSPYIIALVTVAFGYVVAKTLARAAEKLALQKGTQHSATIAYKSVYYIVFLLSFVAALSQLGIKVTGLLAAAGIFTVALGFAAQTSVSNVISGFFLLFDRPFSINDTVKIDTTLGTVVSIELLSTRIRTFDNLMIRIPNETLLKSTIINYTLFNVRRADIPVSVAYGTDINHTREILLAALQKHPLVFDEPSPVILVDSLGESGVRLIIRAWVERTDYIMVKSELTLEIHDALIRERIKVAFPKRDVYLYQPNDSPSELSDDTPSNNASHLSTIRVKDTKKIEDTAPG